MGTSLYPETPAQRDKNTSLFPDQSKSPLDEQLSRSQSIGIKVSADSASRIMRMQLKTGLPRDFISRNLDEIEAESKKRDFDPADYRRRNPAVAQWLSENPDHYSLAQDDLSQLGFIESATRAIKKGWKSGKGQSELGRWGNYAMSQRGTLTAEQQKRVDQLQGEVSRTPVGSKFWQDVLYSTAQVVGQMADGAEEAFTGAAQGFLAGGTIGALGGGGIASIATAPAGAALGAAVGLVSGMARYTYMVESGQAYLGLSEIRGRNGEQLSEDIKIAAATGVGVLNAILEMTGEAAIAYPFYAAGKKFARSAAADMLVRPTMASAMAEFGKNYALALGGEVSTEVAQEMTNIVAEEFSKMMTHGSFNTLVNSPDQREAMMERLGGIAKQTAEGMMLLGLPGASVKMAADIVSARRAQNREKLFLALGEGVKDSKTYQNLPDAMKRVVDSATKGGPVENLFVDPESFSEYWQSKSVDPREVARELWGSTEAYDRALQTGEPMAIPTSTYATKLAPTEHNTFFAKEIRRSPSEMNAREAKELEKKLMELAAEAAATEPQSVIREQLLNNISSQLADTGRYDKETSSLLAEQMVSFFTTMAEKTGQNPVDLFNHYGITITAGEPQSVLERVKSFMQRVIGNKNVKDDRQASVYTLDSFDKVEKDSVEESILQELGAEDYDVKDLTFVISKNTIKMDEEGPWRITAFITGSKTPIGHYSSFGSYKRVQDFAEKVGMVRSKEFFQKDITPLPSMHSKAERLVRDKMGGRAKPSEVKAMLLANGVKQDEMDWSVGPVLDALEDVSVDKATMLQLLEQGKLKIEERIATDEGFDEHAYNERLAEVQAQMFEDYVNGHLDEFIDAKPDYNGNVVAHYWNFASGRQSGVEVYRGTDRQHAIERLMLEAYQDTALDDYIYKRASEVVDVSDYAGESAYEQYTLPGIRNYREILFSLPNISGRKFTGAHHQQIDNIFLHLRIVDKIDAQGRKVMFLEEVQSDWHEQGRKRGYESPEREAEAAEIEKRNKERRGRYGQALSSFNDILHKVAKEVTSTEQEMKEAIQDYNDGTGTALGVLLENNPEVVAARKFLIDNSEFSYETPLVLNVPSAPFKKTWHEFAMRRALQMAVEGGYDAIGWTIGDQQNARYGKERTVGGVSYDPVDKNLYYLIYKTDHTEGENWEPAVLREVEPEEIPKFIGRELAKALLSSPVEEVGGDNPSHQIVDEKGIRVGGFGMRGFYDDMLVKYANKLGKLGKARVEDGVIDYGTAFADDDVQIEYNEEEDVFQVIAVAKGGPVAEGRTMAEATQKALAMHELVITPALADYVRGQGLELFQPDGWKSVGNDTDGGHAGARGSISFRGNEVNIKLMESANLSTFLHESGHLYLEIFKDLAKKDKVLAEDYKIIREYLGHERGAFTREQHEKWARSIEAYFREGRAPSAALRRAFHRFRSWLMTLYATLTGLDVKLTDEVRGVMDRMFASQREIDAAQAEASVSQFFLTPDQAGMTAEEFESYRGLVQDEHDKAVERLQLKLIREQQAERSAEQQEAMSQFAAEAEREVGNRPVYRALSALQKGEWYLQNGDITEIKIKLDRAEIEKTKGKEYMARLPKGISTRDGGTRLAQAAELFGFTSADEMLESLSTAPPMQREVGRIANERMKAKYGDMQLDGRMADEAEKEVLSNGREKVILAELRALRKFLRETSPDRKIEKLRSSIRDIEKERQYERRWMEAEAKLRIKIAEGAKDAELEELRAEIARNKAEIVRGRAEFKEALPNLADVRALAEDRMRQTRVRDIRPDIHWSASRKSARLATEALSKGDYAAAANFKQSELLNVALYRAAQSYKEKADKMAAYARRLEKSQSQRRIGKIDPEYRDQINRILERFDFSRISNTEIDKRASLAEFIKSQERLGMPVNIPVEVQDEAFRKPWKEMTMEELLGVKDTLKHIEHLARLKGRLMAAQRERSFNDAKLAIADEIRSNAKRTIPREAETRLPSQGAVQAIDGFFASHRKLSSLLRQMAGFKDGGPLFDFILRRVNRSADRHATMVHQAAVDLREIFESHYSKSEMLKMYEKTAAPSLGTSLSRMGRIMLALNWGTEDNRTKLVDGLSVTFDREVTASDVEAAMSALTKNDHDFVQSIHNYLDTYWPAMRDLAERMDGVVPEKIAAIPRMTPFGEYKGGYFPLSYDDKQSNLARENIVNKRATDVRRASAIIRSTKAGARMERVSGVHMPVRLDFGVIMDHLEDVIQDLTHTDMLIDVNRLIQSEEVQSAIRDHYGDTTYRQITSVMRDIATGDLPARDSFERSVNWFRTGTSIAMLSWNVTTGLLQPLGLTQSIVRIGPKWVARGMMRWLRDASSMENSLKWIHEKSEFMRARSRTQLREISEIRNHIGLAQGQVSRYIDWGISEATAGNIDLQDVQDSFFWLITRMQLVADIPTWLGEYEKQMELLDGDEEKAIALADQSVIDSQSTGYIKDLAAVQRGGPMKKLWSNFYSFFSATYNLMAESSNRLDIKKPSSYGRFASDFLLLTAVPAVLGLALRNAVQGNDDPDDWSINRFMKEEMSYLFSMMMGFRELSGMIQGFYGYEGPAGSRIYAEAGKFLQQVAQGKHDKAFWQSLNNTAGIMFHYPSAQVQRTVSGFRQWMSNKAPISAIMFGPPPSRR